MCVRERGIQRKKERENETENREIERNEYVKMKKLFILKRERKSIPTDHVLSIIKC